MAKVFSFTGKAAAPIAACFLAALLVVVARAQDKAQLTGHWNFNKDQSDDAEQKVHDAQANSRRSSGYPGSGGGYPGGGGGMGRGGMGGMGGMGGIGGMGRGRRGMGNPGSSVSSQEWNRLAENPKFLRIDQRSDQFVVIDDSDRAQTFYPDGKKHKDKDADGNKISTKASWEGGAFIAETKLPHSEKLRQTFRMSEDGKQLHVITRFEASSGNVSVSIRRVYDMGKAPAQ
ncbi:MAG: hypothetical protein ABSC21_20885 [Terriglobia bacterium]|jgi:hypothetical protein